ncbi:hypothetical protein CC78DRAFT_598220 [Lojkania enalia]|uniref:Uncharacterized protein n=1 Tax=Lojkania enalia TaxID=147567 RepID=A0A9P4JVD6_9PLEO|nr:hypothetical protein CC78DRAFT_598220 [Didymosphaeria enalia]
METLSQKQIQHQYQGLEVQPMPLPIELVLHIITCVLPNPGSFLTRSNPITKMLLSFTLVCFETYRLARRYLREHCIYISTSIHLSSILLSIPCSPGSELCKVPSLYLAPFKETIDDLPVALWTRELLLYTSPTLRKLVIDIPLRSLCAEEDRLDVRRILRDGFAQLERLEEFVSVQDDLFLDLARDSEKAFVWRQWPNLKRLALYRAEFSEEFWRNVGKMPTLNMLMLVRPIGLQEFCVKTKAFEQFPGGRSLNLFLVNAENEAVLDIPATGWKVADASKAMNIWRYDLATSPIGRDVGEACREWIKTKTMNNTLWCL